MFIRRLLVAQMWERGSERNTDLVLTGIFSDSAIPIIIRGFKPLAFSLHFRIKEIPSIGPPSHRNIRRGGMMLSQRTSYALSGYHDVTSAARLMQGAHVGVLAN